MSEKILDKKAIRYKSNEKEILKCFANTPCFFGVNKIV